MLRARFVIDYRLDQIVVELRLEDQWDNHTVVTRTRCLYTSFQIRLGIPYIRLEYLLM
jgi:hypothetical protein